jgi:hypothetical protein
MSVFVGWICKLTLIHKVGNSIGVFKVGENKQLLIAIVGDSFFIKM